MKVVAIRVAPTSRLPMRPLDAVVAQAGKGLVGDTGEIPNRPGAHLCIDDSIGRAAAAAERIGA